MRLLIVTYFISLLSYTQVDNFCDWQYAVTASNAVIAVEQNNFNNILISDSFGQTVAVSEIQCPVWLGVFYDKVPDMMVCGGYIIWENQNFALTAWADDPTTSEKDGFQDGDSYVFQLCIDNFGLFLGVADMSSNPPFSEFYMNNGFSSINSITFNPSFDTSFSIDFLLQSCWPVNTSENNTKKDILKTIDLYGRDVLSDNKSGFIIQIFNDNTFSKLYQF